MGLYDNLDDLMEENYKNYEVYGDNSKDKVIVENIPQNEEYNGKNLPKEEESEVIVENITENEPIERLPVPYYEEPNFDWDNKNLWINNPSAVKYWMKMGNSINTYNLLYKKHLKELDAPSDLTKTY